MSGKQVEYNLEGLRGIAAFMVVFGHICYRANYLDPGFTVHLPGHYIPPGHFSVIIFFCLSGFVIGHSNRTPMSSIGDATHYLSRRFVRLYPIYLFSILIVLPFAFEFTRDGILLLLKHLTFTNILFAEIYPQNNPLWSLNYEVLYYLLFISLSFLRFPRGKAILLVLALAVINAVMHTRFNFPLVTSYLLGYVFWLTGLKLSEYNLHKRTETPAPSFVISIFLLVICIPEFVTASGLPKLFHAINTPQTVPWVFRAITFDDLLVLPFCAFFILMLTNTAFSGRKMATLIAYAVPLVVLAYVLAARPKAVPGLIVPSVIYGLALLFLLIRKESKVFRSVLSTIIFSGGISYAVYVIHFPLLLLFSRINVFSGTIFTVSVRFVLFMAVLVGVSILLEKYMQPAIRNFVFRKQKA